MQISILLLHAKYICENNALCSLYLTEFLTLVDYIFKLNQRQICLIFNLIAKVLRQQVESITEVLVFDVQLIVLLDGLVMLFSHFEMLVAELHVGHQYFFDHGNALNQSVV